MLVLLLENENCVLSALIYDLSQVFLQTAQLYWRRN